MQRNKLIYALADASLVVSSDMNKGGTWAGATEQLDKLKFVPVYVRSTGETSVGLNALRSEGALPWPNPQDVEALQAVFDGASPTPAQAPQSGLALFSEADAKDIAPLVPSVAEPAPAIEAPSSEVVVPAPEPASLVSRPSEVLPETASTPVSASTTPADAVFSVVRQEITSLLKAPMKDAEVATALEVSTAQAKAWLQRLVEEGVIEKQKKPAGYILKQSSLFD